jgi:hypothetical protein
MTGALVRSLEPVELWRAFGVACERLLGEVDAVAPELGRRLSAPVRELAAGRHTAAG